MNTSEKEILRCSKCKLHKNIVNKERGIPMGWGKGVGKIFIAGLAPTDSRGNYKYAMKSINSSDTASLLNNCFEDVGLKENDFYISNIVKCSFPDNVYDASILDICFNEWFFGELVNVSPSKIVCLGNVVYEYLSQKEGISNVFCFKKVWHHSYIARDRSKYEGWLEQWKIALQS